MDGVLCVESESPPKTKDVRVVWQGLGGVVGTCGPSRSRPRAGLSRGFTHPAGSTRPGVNS